MIVHFVQEERPGAEYEFLWLCGERVGPLCECGPTRRLRRRSRSVQTYFFIFYFTELGTRQHCRDNVTMYSGQKMVDFAVWLKILTIQVQVFVVATPIKHIFYLFLVTESLLHIRVIVIVIVIVKLKIVTCPTNFPPVTSPPGPRFRRTPWPGRSGWWRASFDPHTRRLPPLAPPGCSPLTGYS